MTIRISIEIISGLKFNCFKLVGNFEFCNSFKYLVDFIGIKVNFWLHFKTLTENLSRLGMIYKLILSIFASYFVSGWALQKNLHAADFSDQEWPCIQRKVETLSVAQIWPTPIVEQDLGVFRNEIKSLASNLTLRRLTQEESTELVKEFIQDYPDIDRKQLLEQVFLDFFDRMNLRRGEVMAGISRYAINQVELSEKIDLNRLEFNELLKAEPQDFDKIDELEEKIDWDQRIFDERAKSLEYVCEIPVLIEKHTYSIGQILQKEIQDVTD